MVRTAAACLLCVVSSFAGVDGDYKLGSFRTPGMLCAYTAHGSQDLTLQGYSLVRQIPDVSLEETIEKGISLGIFGTVTHLSGFIMYGVALPITVHELQLRKESPSRPFPSAGLTFSILGALLSAAGALPSCIGAASIEESMEDSNISFTRNMYWNYYVRSWAYEIVGWGLFTIGSLTMKGSHEEVGPTLVLVGLYGLEIGGEIYRAIAAIGPIAYGKKARRYMAKRHSATIQVQPCVSFEGGAGLRVSLIF